MDGSIHMSRRSTLAQLASAPHRPFFLAGAVQLAVTQAYWLVSLAGMVFGRSPAIVADPFVTHGFLMIYGIFPFFALGFLFTAYPRWLEGPEIPSSVYQWVFLTLIGGLLLVYLGIFISPALFATGAIVFLLGYLGAIWQLGRVYRLSRHLDRRHEAYIWGWLAGGAPGLGLFILGLAWGRATWVSAAFSAALWLYLVPLTATVCYRLIPFFSSRALPGYRMVRSPWVLPAIAVFSVGHFLLRWGLGTQWCMLSDLPFLVLALYLSARWGLLRSFRIRLLAMLHVGFAWLSVALALYVARGLLPILGVDFPVGLAPLHALGIGFLVSTLLAIATRVSLGHSGRPLEADIVAGWTFWGIGATAALRVASALPWAAGWHGPFWVATSTLWLMAVLPWVWRYGGMSLRPPVTPS